MSDDFLKPGQPLSGRLFRGFLQSLADRHEPQPGDRIGAWRILEQLGRGGSGVVFLAERADGAYSQQVAIKWLRSDRPVPGGATLLARERALLASLDHPGIARLVDGGEDKHGQLWFAMDHVPGQSIDLIARDLDLPGRLGLVRRLCQAVHYAHGRGVIHGDIKPANVRVDERGHPRLLDFGIARLKASALASSYGLTPEYASPEQRRGEPLTTASDIWQLGRLLDDLVEPEQRSADLNAIIDQARAEHPDDRYSSAAALADDLLAVEQRRPVAARNGGLIYRVTCLLERNRLASLALAMAVFLVSGSGIWMAWQLAQERDLARYQAERAMAALHETEMALARAERLHDFLIGLFQAGRPDRPRDQLPGTAEILERGAQQALEPASAPAGERLGMLLAIGQVYRARSQYDKARPLIEEAVRLTQKDHERLGPKDRAVALAGMAELMIVDGDDLDQAEAMLIDAEALLPAGQLDPLIPIRIGRTWIERHRGQHARALGLVEPLAERVHAGEPVSLHRRARLFDALAGLQAAAGNLEQASRFRTLSIEAMRQTQGEEGQGYVVSLANSVGLEMALGNFAEAERRARRAIALYDRIYPEAVDFRAVVRDSLARLKLTTGRVEQAFEQQSLAGIEQAESLGAEPERWPLLFSRRASFQARLGQLDPAVENMQRAHELLDEHGGLGPRLADTMDMLLAWVLCLDGQGSVGADLLDGVDPSASILGNQRTRAQWHEARAACHHALGQQEQALAAINQALEQTTAPGQVLDRFDRRLLKARILTAKGQPSQAQALRQQAREDWLALGLAHHPVLERVSP